MDKGITVLAITAASIGFFHTLFGPDHYLPFIVMAKARKWSTIKTIWITILCGLGHVGSSIILGTIGILFGIGVNRLENMESSRGNMAAWAFIIFGLLYFLWGLRRAILNKEHKHIHLHDGIEHTHTHVHHDEHDHIHKTEKVTNLTPWILFLIFVFGPCEPLIPMLMYPAAQNNIYGLILIVVIFTVITLATMLTLVVLLSSGFKLINLGKLEKYSHAIAGAAIFLSGCAIVFIGL